MAYNPLDEKFINAELKMLLHSKTNATNARLYKWRERFKTGEMRTGKKIEILLTYGDFELVKKKN